MEDVIKLWKYALFLCISVGLVTGGSYYCGVTLICPDCPNGTTPYATCEVAGSIDGSYTCDYSHDDTSITCQAKDSNGFILAETTAHCPTCPKVNDGTWTGDPSGCDPSSPTWYTECDPWAV